jgi:hypothetical protein
MYKSESPWGAYPKNMSLIPFLYGHRNGIFNYKEETTMNMKKTLALLLAAVLLVGVLSACGNGEANAPSASEEPAAEPAGRSTL